MFDRIMKWYKQGLWDDAKVYNAVEKGVITSAQYAEITGKEYK